jgi:hypothetical protein
MVGWTQTTTPCGLAARRRPYEWQECTRYLQGRARPFAVNDVPLSGSFTAGVTIVRNQLEKTVLHLAFGVRCYECALALTPYQQVFGRQLVDRLAHSTLADLEAGRQFNFAGNDRAGLPFASLQALQDENLDLLVQRAEGWRLLRSSDSRAHLKQAGSSAFFEGCWRCGHENSLKKSASSQSRIHSESYLI